MNITMYSKNQCGLCEKAKKIVEELQQEFSFSIEEIDIYEDDQLLEMYQLMIPVVKIDDVLVAYGIINKTQLRIYIEAHLT